ncbi:MAG: hypothetical protein DWQ01_16845 [Planctomycetota bacterium]|nr:MAG: hypothetical protein DWQ01_16845 [Planctomycetota bacterium]
MTDLLTLWLPILASAAAVFVASYLMWMVLPHHRSDWGPLPDEDGFMNTLRDLGVRGPGQYSFPYCGSAEEFKNPELIKKMENGPSGMLTVMKPGPLNMGSSMLLCFLQYVGIGVLVAYAASRVMAPGTDYLKVFQLTGTMAILAYCASLPTQSIWFHQKWSGTLKSMLDGVVYGLITAGLFGWLWPDAA